MYPLGSDLRSPIQQRAKGREISTFTHQKSQLYIILFSFDHRHTRRDRSSSKAALHLPYLSQSLLGPLDKMSEIPKKQNLQTAPTPQNTPANNAPISSHAQQPGVGTIKEGKMNLSTPHHALFVDCLQSPQRSLIAQQLHLSSPKTPNLSK